MNVLLVSPNPFFEERGTCIAVRTLCETLCAAGHSVDLLTYHVGDDIQVPRLRILRTPRLPFITRMPIGFSFRKLACDLFLSLKLFLLIWHRRYDVVHAVEEAIFPVCLVKIFAPVHLIYDMDSSLPDQLLQKYAYLRPVHPLLCAVEKLLIRRTDIVIAVSEDLAKRAQRSHPGGHVLVLHDVPQVSNREWCTVDNLKETLGLSGPIIMYVGNLEHYQGIDLLLEAFAAARATSESHLVIIGGTQATIAKYTNKAAVLGVSSSTYFLGPRPLAQLPQLLEQACIVVSPRLYGTNTPMKLYSYLASGRPIVATDIRSHTQVLDASCAVLVEPTPLNLADAFHRLIRDPELRAQIGATGKKLVAEKYSSTKYRKKLLDAYAQIDRQRRAC